MICAILIGREGSSGFPGKNVHPLLGRPMVEWPILAARECSLIDRIDVSTDSPRIKEIAHRHGAHVIDRPAELCTREALGEHAFQHAHQVISRALREAGKAPSIYVLLMANAPTIHAGLLEQGIQALLDKPELDSAVTVSCYNMWSPLRARRIDPEDGLLRPFVPFAVFGDPATLNCDRDSQGDVWFADMSASIIRPANLDDLDAGLLPQKWMGQRIFPIANVGGLDVDYDYQMPQAEWWLKRHRPDDLPTSP